MLAHVVPQHVSPALQPRGPHAPTHTPPEHVSPGAHVRPHVPQFVGLDARSASQPSVAIALQLPKPVSHAATLQLAAVHPAVAWANGPHTFMQPPQWVGSLDRSEQKSPQHVSPSRQPLRHARLQV